MALEGNLSSGKITNHSGRKMAIQTLLHAGIPPTDVMQLTGHKNVQSLNSYSHLSTAQQQSMSNLLSTQLSAQESKLIEPAEAVAAPSAEAPSHFNSLNYGLDDSIISQLDEPFDNEEQQITVTSQAQITTQSATASKTIRKRLPLHSGAYNFLNGTTVHGNISINFNSNTPKRRRVDNYTAIQDSEESEE